MKKIITIEYEQGATKDCSPCPLDEIGICGSLKHFGLNCGKSTIKSVTIKDEQ